MTTKLSPRELKLFKHLTETDDGIKQIAFAMRTSEGTVKSYSNRLYTKLEAKNGRTTLLLREIERLKGRKE